MIPFFCRKCASPEHMDTANAKCPETWDEKCVRCGDDSHTKGDIQKCLETRGSIQSWRCANCSDDPLYRHASNHPTESEKCQHPKTLAMRAQVAGFDGRSPDWYKESMSQEPPEYPETCDDEKKRKAAVQKHKDKAKAKAMAKANTDTATALEEQANTDTASKTKQATLVVVPTTATAALAGSAKAPIEIPDITAAPDAARAPAATRSYTASQSTSSTIPSSSQSSSQSTSSTIPSSSQSSSQSTSSTIPSSSQPSSQSSTSELPGKIVYQSSKPPGFRRAGMVSFLETTSAVVGPSLLLPEPDNHKESPVHTHTLRLGRPVAQEPAEQPAEQPAEEEFVRTPVKRGRGRPRKAPAPPRKKLHKPSNDSHANSRPTSNNTESADAQTSIDEQRDPDYEGAGQPSRSKRSLRSSSERETAAAREDSSSNDPNYGSSQPIHNDDGRDDVPDPPSDGPANTNANAVSNRLRAVRKRQSILTFKPFS